MFPEKYIKREENNLIQNVRMLKNISMKFNNIWIIVIPFFKGKHIIYFITIDCFLRNVLDCSCIVQDLILICKIILGRNIISSDIMKETKLSTTDKSPIF